jgi:hypothetical protein
MTPAATKTAPVAAYRHHPGTGPVVTHWLVLNGVYIDGRNNTVGQVIQRAITVDVCLAETTLTMANLAAPQAEVTAGGAVIQFFLQAGFDQLIGLQIGHGGTGS